MSISYMFVNEQRKGDLKQVETILKTQKDALTEKLMEFVRDHPHMSDTVDGAIFELDHCLAFQSMDVYQEEHVIGVSTARGFQWREENGFARLQDVKNFLAENTGYAIQNDSGAKIAFSDFERMINSRN